METHWTDHSIPRTPQSGVVLVTGATGRQGGTVVRHMLAGGYRLRALTRDPGASAAKSLAEQGVEIVGGDLAEPGSPGSAVGGARGAFSMRDLWCVGGNLEVQQDRTVA